MKKVAKNILNYHLALLLVCLVSVGCVSQKGYREVKAQMLNSELEIIALRAAADSLYKVTLQKDKTIAKQELEKQQLQKAIDNQKTQISRLTVDNELLRKEL